MRRVLAGASVLLLLGGLVWAWRSGYYPPSKPKQVLTVAYPMGIQVPFLAAAERFEALHPEVAVELLGGTPEALARDLTEGAKIADVFVSPGGHEATVLVAKGMLDQASLVAFGSYALALLVPVANPGGVGSPADLLGPAVRGVSLSDRELSAVTHAARVALGSEGVWERLEPKIVFTADCAESYQALVNGKVEANLQFAGCPMRPGTTERAQQAKVVEAYRFPRDACYVPRNVAGVVKGSPQYRLARAFVSFLGSPDTQRLMVEKGLRDDANLPLLPGTWRPTQEAPPPA